jgi:acyl-CoA synthetase (AMP-forming)/AMP-acid ligase II
VTPPAAPTLAHRLEELSASQPESSAIVTSTTHYTYAELLAEARKIARQLAGLPPSTRVLLLVSEPEEDLIASFIGVHLAGLIPCLANPALAESKRAAALRALRPGAVITDGLRISLRLSAAGSKKNEAEAPCQANYAAYVGMSSGTTGPPKHTVASTAGMMEFAGWAIREFGFARADRWGLVASPWTDMGVANIWLALLSGAALVPLWSPVDRAFFGRRARDFGITVCRTLPRLIDLAGRSRDAPGPLAGLRILAFGGDYLTWRQVRAARRIAPVAEMINTYGTAETSGFVSYYRIPDRGDGPGEGTVPIGTPAPHTAMRVRRPDRGGPQEIEFCGPNLPVGQIPAGGYDEPTWERICRGRWAGPAIRGSGDLGFCAGGLWKLTGRASRQAKVPSGDWVNLDVVEKILSRTVNAPCLVIAHGGSIFGLILVSRAQPRPDALAHSVQLRHPELGTGLECRLVTCPELPVNTAGKPDYERCRLIAEAADAGAGEDARAMPA